MSGVGKKENIIIVNANENNLKNITVKIPINKMTCVTGPSGCGKSSLIYDTLYAESQRNFLESMSGMIFGHKLMDKPHVDRIENLHPALNISQNYFNVNPRSTVGTVTEISHYLRTVYALVSGQDNNNASINSSSFSANSPMAFCPKCKGTGQEYFIDEDKLIPDRKKPLSKGGILYYKGSKESHEYSQLVEECRILGIDINKSIDELSEDEREKLLYTETEREIVYKYRPKKKLGGKPRSLRSASIIRGGIVSYLNSLIDDIETPSTKKSIDKFLGRRTCSECKGKKLRETSLSVTICGRSISDVEEMNLQEMNKWIQQVKNEYSDKVYSSQIVQLLDEIKKRVKSLIELKLEYISLGRGIQTLSSGEIQRVRISHQLNCDLSGLMYILDEPCKGLHYRNIKAIEEAVHELVKKGNTVIAIEHNRLFARGADYIIEMGPKGGPNGGRIEYHGIPKLRETKLSFQGRHESVCFVNIKNIHYHNLKGVDLSFPIGEITAITGVSGSGKSSMTTVVELDLLANKSRHCEKITTDEKISKVIKVDQKPIGTTPRSTVATYIDVYTDIRSLFASTNMAEEFGLTAGDFSMNKDGGRCEDCDGYGKKKIELDYLPEAYILCPSCKGKRFKKRILSVLYNNMSINDILDASIEEVIGVFDIDSTIYEKLECLIDVGLGYISLGQMSMNLSGGEAQRIKLAKNLSSKSKKNTLFILDEPTTGLGSDDQVLIEKVLLRLKEQGNTLLVIEHNMDFIARISDYMVDLGCESGIDGGSTIIMGTPEEVIKDKKSSWYGTDDFK